MDDVQVFGAEHVRRLTGLSDRQLRYWDSTGFFAPHYADENRRRPYSRVYSFQDLVGLRTIAILHREHGIPMSELREVARWLTAHPEHTWSSLQFYVGGRHVYFDDPSTGARMAGRLQGQTAFPFEMREIINHTREDANRLRERQAAEIGQITHHRYVVRNADVIAGTRIPTSAVWAFHSAGYDTEAIIREYPQLTPADVAAAIAEEDNRQHAKAS